MTDYGTDWVDEPKLHRDSDGERYISASQIKTFWKCPKQYWYKYRTEKEPTKISKGYRELGIAVHESIELVLEQPNITFSESHLDRRFKQQYRELDPDVSSSMYDDGLDFLEVAARYVAAKEPRIRDVEKEVVYGLGRDDIDSNIKAIIDVCTENEIWDWKTGRVRDDTPMEEKIQGAIYMKAYERAYGVPPDRIQFIYLKEESERTLKPSDAVWDEMIEKAAGLIEEIERGNWKGNPGDPCFWCGYEIYCEDSEVGVGNIDPIQY